MKKNKAKKIICTAEEAIRETKKGKMFIIVDDKARENEGDLFVAAAHITSEKLNFMITHAKGLVCVPLTKERAEKLAFPLMVHEKKNEEFTQCNFTVSVDARKGIGSGISADDRARTIKLIADPKSRPTDFVKPGHIFPIVAKNGGLEERKGHTEAAVELARWAGIASVGVICELIDKNGAMMRFPSLIAFAKKHALKMVLVKDLIEYKRNKKNCIDQLSEASLLTSYGKFCAKVYRSRRDKQEHLVLTYGDIRNKKNLLVRIHSQCLTGEVFGSLRCDCQTQLKKSLEIITKIGCGIIIYLKQEGRGIGLENKIKAYHLQERGLDTGEANKALGFELDEREFKDAAEILNHLGIKTVSLLTNNPAKVKGLRENGILVAKSIPLHVAPTRYNRYYLKIKKEKLGHQLKI